VDQRISLITLGVADVARARAFYERLGWCGQEVQQTVFFQAGGLGLVLWHEDRLAEDAGFDGVRSHGFRGINLAHNVRTREEVDAIISAAGEAGGTVTRAPADTFYGGYAGHFTDPDGHAWEIAYNPGFPLGEDGTLTIPDLGAP
jgi:predicted lactoylglutathione lyase